MTGPFFLILFLILKNVGSFDVTTDGKQSPDVDATTLQMIRRAGYPAEAHAVVTEDEYILTVHRIPGGPKSKAVYLQHGLFGTSADWIIPGKRKSLAFILADLGYDVFLGNFRGNTYSRAHMYLSPSDYKFWQFSWHECGVHDLPAVITYITNMKNDSLFYVGHSMGTTTFYVMASLRPDIASKVKTMFSLAPVAYMKHIKSPLRYIAPFANDVEIIYRVLGRGDFAPNEAFIKYLAKFTCELDTLEEELCENFIFLFSGFDSAQFNRSLLPLVLGHDPAGASVMTVVHYAQLIVSNKFCQYDFGTKKNMEIYKNSTPPDYDLSKISVPVVLFYGKNDWFSDVLDLNRLYKSLRTVKLITVPFPKFNHLDFIWATDAPKLVYDKLIYIMEKASESE